MNLEQLKAANRIDPDAESNAAVNVYLIEADGKHLLEPHVVDFTQVTSIRMEDVGYVLKRKVLKMELATRREFQLKLAYFYGRRAS